ncbi:trk system potassium uptake protein TrkA [Mycoplasmoides fastidiosum]|uniref:Trk system potassium uptake protein TrkA n=1 Tax=Mycoplasmoides fastidiosum TaxID=92758 RepID=A0ABU0LYM9_9BACT|nr:TrkA family potassium uptake protein [Mycoplasmoides fastidiosum]MDQ0513794.1 trk system potassium uptake protein TrkA [Mycoplasmoides fastidiosum]UUD37788.1 TrkA family potassium uptake protein [Mycoplasmoides fastidiosum]
MDIKLFKHRTNRLVKNYCIIGLGRFGYGVAEVLQKEHQNLTIIDFDEEVVELKGKDFSDVQLVDATNIHNLTDIGIKDYDIIIVAVSDFEKSIIICSNLRELGIKNIIAKATNLIHQRILKSMGVSRTIIPDVEIASKVAYQSIYGLNVDLFRFDQADSQKSFIVEVPVFASSLWKKSVAEITNKFGHRQFTIIAIKNSKGEIRMPIRGTDIINRGDIVFLISVVTNISSIIDVFQKD